MKDELAMLRYIDFTRMRSKGKPIQKPGDIGCFITQPNFYIKKTEKMQNYQLVQRLSRVKNDLDNLFDFLVEEIEDLETELSKQDSLIESLEEQIQDLKIENSELKTRLK